MTANDIIDGILEREGENRRVVKGVPTYLAPGDLGGRTTWGISERSHPEVWKHGPPSKATARAIYWSEYVRPWDWIAYSDLRNQMVDCTVLHGKTNAVKLLQRGLGITDDGTMGPLTQACYRAIPTIAAYRYLNNSIVAFRLAFIDRISDATASQKINEEGWENRALEFLI